MSKPGRTKRSRAAVSAPSDAATTAVSRWLVLGVPAALAAITFVCFARGLSNPFVNWDDPINFVNNPHYRGFSGANIRWMFTYHKGHYTPLTWVSLGVDYMLWGMNPWGYHLHSLLLHVANVVVFYFVAGELLSVSVGRTASGGASPFSRWVGAAFAALVFGIHPLRVESVVWATQRRDVLSGLFCLLTVWAYLRSVRAGDGRDVRRRWYVFALIALLLSLGSKIMAIALPLVLLALDVYPLRRLAEDRTSWKRLMVEKLPFAALSIVAGFIALWAERTAGAIYAANQHHLIDSLMQPGYRIFFYVGKTLAPLGLSPLYPYRAIGNTVDLKYVVGTAALLAVTATLWLLRRKWPGGLVTWLCYGLLIGPVVGVVQFGPHFAADRNTYVACLPWALLAGGGAAWLARHVGPKGAKAVSAAAAVVLLGLGFLTIQQTQVWSASLSLWNQAVAADPDSAVARNARAMARLEAGDADGALEDFDRAVQIEPGYGAAYNNRGTAWLHKNIADKALADFDRALQIDPLHAQALFNRCLVHVGTGLASAAIVDCTAGLKLVPNDNRALRSRAIARLAMNDLPGAIDDASAALQTDGNDYESLGTRGVARARTGDLLGATSDLERALAVAPATWARIPVAKRLLQQLRSGPR